MNFETKSYIDSYIVFKPPRILNLTLGIESKALMAFQFDLTTLRVISNLS